MRRASCPGEVGSVDSRVVRDVPGEAWPPILMLNVMPARYRRNAPRTGRSYLQRDAIRVWFVPVTGGSAGSPAAPFCSQAKLHARA